MFDHPDRIIGMHVAGYYEGGIGRMIKSLEEIGNVVEGRFFNMADVFAYGSPAIGMYLICQWAQMEPDVPIRLVKVSLFEFFNHHIFLNIQAALME